MSPERKGRRRSIANFGPFRGREAPELKLNHLIPGSGHEIPETPLEELGHIPFGPLPESHLKIYPGRERIVVGDFREVELEEAEAKVQEAFKRLNKTLKKHNQD